LDILSNQWRTNPSSWKQFPFPQCLPIRSNFSTLEKFIPLQLPTELNLVKKDENDVKNVKSKSSQESEYSVV
jgi:hypothetical protein